MHAAGYLNTCCEKLGIADAAKEFRTCRAIMLRHGAGARRNMAQIFNELKSHPYSLRHIHWGQSLPNRMTELS